VSIWASPDKVQYRMKVLIMLKENKDNKFPAFNEFYDSSKKEGTLFDAIAAFALVCDAHFTKNLTISTCANRVEEITIIGKKAAEDLFAQYLKEATASDTKH
jgi:hypothetical protein